MNILDFSIPTELRADCASGRSTVKLEISIVGESLEFHPQKRNGDFSCDYVSEKFRLEIFKYSFCEGLFQWSQNASWQLYHGTFILQVLSEFFKPALPIVVVWILPQGNKCNWISYITDHDGNHWKVNRQLYVALSASYNFLIEICNVSEESLLCELNFAGETLTLPNVSTK